MKRSIIFTAITAILFCATTVFAQTPEEWKASDERIAEMQKLKQPKATKIESVDGLATDLNDAITASVKTTEELKSLGQAPVLKAALALAEEIEKEVTLLADAAQKMMSVTGEVQSITNPLQVVSATKSVAYSGKALKLITEESVFHGKVIAEMIKSLKSE